MSIDEAADLAPLCRHLARWLHRGTRDLQGAPYVHHLESVAARMPAGSLAECAAWLHDAAEDFLVSPDAFHEIVLPTQLIHALGALTRRGPADTREPYAEYIERVAANPVARKVKLADLESNLDPSRGPIPDSLRARYEAARERLMGAEGA